MLPTVSSRLIPSLVNLALLVSWSACVSISTCSVTRAALGSTAYFAFDPSQATTDNVPLKPGTTPEKSLRGGETHNYRIDLQKNQYLHAVVIQRGIDVVVTLFGPDNKQLSQVDSPNGTDGPEPLYWIAQEQGSYRLEIRSLEEKASPGRYEIQFQELRTASKADHENFNRMMRLLEASSMDARVVELYVKRNYEPALDLAKKSLTIRQQHLPSDDPLLAESLFNLASVYFALGQYVPAEPLFKQALTIREAKFGQQDLVVANSLNSLAGLYQAVGNYEQAETLFKQALTIRQTKLGLRDPSVAQSLNNLGLLYKDKRNYVEAEKLFLRSLEIMKQTLGTEDHPTVANLFNSLAVMYQEQGELGRAEPLYRRALEVQQKIFGPNNPDVANTAQNLAVLYLLQKDFARAEPLFTNAIEILKKSLGPQHPRYANALESLAIMYQAKGDVSQAIKFQTQSNEIRERNLALIIATGSEQQKRLYMDTLDIETDITTTLNVRSAPKSSEAAALALTTILRRKGRILDAMTDSMESLRRRSSQADRKLVELLSKRRSELSNAVLSGPTAADIDHYTENLVKLEQQTRDLEEQISQRSAEFRAQSEPITLESIQKALPADSVLVEISTYRPFNPLALTKRDATAASRYVAYVLQSFGAPLWVELGDGAEIDKRVAELRGLLSDPTSNVKDAARGFDEQVMHPIRKLIGDKKNIFLSCDGALNLIPFSSLVDENNRYLVETYRITYLTSGRDLLRLQAKVASKQAPVIVADPTFDRQVAAAKTRADRQSRRSFDLADVMFASLPGTAGEATALKRILPDAAVLTKTRATEGAVKHVKGPKVLHVATHGFFLPDSTSDDQQENPLLRSGIVLAGANYRKGGNGEDGILTALEAAGLDLWGTKIVVLSACETGVGEVRNGEGVYGLRRALVLAGSESQVISLWKVNDLATRDLMVGYYAFLRSGVGRTEALRRVQLKMLLGVGEQETTDRRGIGLGAGRGASKQNRRHPFYWASFIQSGDWRSVRAF